MDLNVQRHAQSRSFARISKLFLAFRMFRQSERELHLMRLQHPIRRLVSGSAPAGSQPLEAVHSRASGGCALSGLCRRHSGDLREAGAVNGGVGAPTAQALREDLCLARSPSGLPRLQYPRLPGSASAGFRALKRSGGRSGNPDRSPSTGSL